PAVLAGAALRSPPAGAATLGVRRQDQPCAVLLGQLRPGAVAVLGSAGARPPGHTRHAPADPARGLLARGGGVRLLAGRRALSGGDVLRVRLSGAAGLPRGARSTGRRLLERRA